MSAVQDGVIRVDKITHAAVVAFAGKFSAAAFAN